MSATRTIVVFGSGPGIGRSVAQEFASNGFNHVILLARHHARLDQDKMAVEKSSKDVKVDLLTVNLADKASVKEALTKIDSLSKDIECVFYNGARVAPSTLLEFPVEEMELDFKVYKLFSSSPSSKLIIYRQQTRDSTLSHSGAYRSFRFLQSRIPPLSPRYLSPTAFSTNTLSQRCFL